MKTLELLNKNWSFFDNSWSFGSGPVPLTRYEEIVAKAQTEIITTLFDEVPNLKSFSVSHVWGENVIVSINDSQAPWMNDFSSKDAFKSWLVEVNLKRSEYDLLVKVLPALSTKKEYYSRNKDYKDKNK